VALGQVFLRVVGFPLSISFHWCSINCKNLVKSAHPPIITIGVAQKALRLWCEGPSSQKKKKMASEAGIRRRAARRVTWRHLLGQQIGTEKTIWLHDAAQLGKWRTSGLARVGSARLWNKSCCSMNLQMSSFDHSSLPNTNCGTENFTLRTPRQQKTTTRPTCIETWTRLARRVDCKPRVAATAARAESLWGSWKHRFCGDPTSLAPPNTSRAEPGRIHGAFEYDSVSMTSVMT
jgi:hypothetical protein